ncbi:MAG TPA: helix-turn-helix transcriptional regulator, partial [Thermoanaerobaculia bacterium]
RPRRFGEPPVRCYAVTLPTGGVLDGIVDDWDRLVYASRGSMRVSTAAGEWMVPPHRAVWVPSGIRHHVRMKGRVSFRTLYFRTDVSRDLPRECRVVNVSPLLRELILYLTRRAASDPRLESDGALVSLLLDQLRSVEVVALQLPLPRDPRALAAANLLRALPANRRSLGAIGRACGASSRTLQRLFSAETGLTFEKWRQRARLSRAIELLSEGRKVSAAAADVGYESPSAFIAMFRRELGSTPRAYLAGSARASVRRPGRAPL